eukprot:GFUD01022371.1.p1 GENE.GFUD01022371.1~~GFUD01022371.1.p1  ORF type:complete len:383 (+),score=123.35 GFUD01022371.1:29-1150(+)
MSNKLKQEKLVKPFTNCEHSEKGGKSDKIVQGKQNTAHSPHRKDKCAEVEKNKSTKWSKVQKIKIFNMFHQKPVPVETRGNKVRKMIQDIESGKMNPRTFSMSEIELVKCTENKNVSTCYSKLPPINEKGRIQRAREKISESFQMRKENLEKLTKKGIFKPNRVFGSTIPAIAKSDGTPVPVVLSSIISLISTNPTFMSTEGLYRQNGNLATIQSLRFEIENGQQAKLETVKNVHILTGLAKLFLRELKEPLISWSTLEKLVLALQDIGQTEVEKVMIKVENILSIMHQSNKSSLYAVLEHLSTVADLSNENNMTAENLAIVLGPTLTWSQGAVKRDTIATIMVRQNNVIEFLITKYPKLKLMKQKESPPIKD